MINNLLQGILLIHLNEKGIDLDECIKQDNKYDPMVEYKICCDLADYLMTKGNEIMQNQESVNKFLKLCNELGIKKAENGFIGKLMDYLLKKIRYIENEYMLIGKY